MTAMTPADDDTPPAHIIVPDHPVPFRIEPGHLFLGKSPAAGGCRGPAPRVGRQLLISGIRENLDRIQKQVSLLSQGVADPSGAAVRPEEVAQFQ